jgi:biopolymer transport protein ExbD
MAKRRKHEEVELEVTTFLNLMVVLIPFLLLTAVFTKITIQELDLPTQAGGAAAPLKPPVIIEVIVRKNVLQISDGKKVLETIQKVNQKYDYKKLSDQLLLLKDENKDKEDVAVLMEPDIEYESVIGVMDAVKVAEVYKPGQEKPDRVTLFPQVSIGDAP